MNSLKGKVINKISIPDLSLIDINTEDAIISGVFFEDKNINIGDEVYILFKEMETAIAKGNLENISHLNCLDATVEDIKVGEILAQIKLKLNNQYISSIITKRSFEKLNLKVGDKVKAVIKSMDIVLERI